MSLFSMLSNRKISQLSGPFQPCNTSLKVRAKRQFYSLCVKRAVDGSLGDDEAKSRKKGSTKNSSKSTSKSTISKTTSKRRKTKVVQNGQTDSVDLMEDNSEQSNNNQGGDKNSKTNNHNSTALNDKDKNSAQSERNQASKKDAEKESESQKDECENNQDSQQSQDNQKESEESLSANIQMSKNSKFYLTDVMGQILEKQSGELDRYHTCGSNSVVQQSWELLEGADEDTFDDLDFFKKNILEKQLKDGFDEFFNQDQIFECWSQHPQNSVPKQIQQELQLVITSCEKIMRVFYLSALVSKKDNSIIKKLKFARRYDRRRINDAQLMMSCTILNSFNKGNLNSYQKSNLLQEITFNNMRLKESGNFSQPLMLIVDCLQSSLIFNDYVYFLSFNHSGGDSGFDHLPLPLKQYISGFLDSLHEYHERLVQQRVGFYSHKMQQLCNVLEFYYVQTNFVQRIFGDNDQRLPTADNYLRWRSLLIKIHGDGGANALQDKYNGIVDQYVDQYRTYETFQQHIEQSPLVNADNNNNNNQGNGEVGFITVGLNPSSGEAQIIIGGLKAENNDNKEQQDSSKSEEQEAHERMGKIFEILGEIATQKGDVNQGEGDIEEHLGNLLGGRGKEPPVFDDSSVGMLGLNPKNEDHKDKIEQIKNSMAIMHYAMQQHSAATKKAAKLKRQQQAEIKKPKRLGYIEDVKKKTTLTADIFYDADKSNFFMDEIDVQVSTLQGKHLAMQGLNNTLSLYCVWMICAGTSIGRGDGQTVQDKLKTVVLVKIRCLNDSSVPEGEFHVGKFFQGKNVKCIQFEKRWMQMKQYIQQICGLSSGTEWETVTELFDPNENRWILSEHWMEWCLWKRLI